ncbi:adenosylcobinamide-GDP ribazoletransferase [Limibacter armeniacum]|uniref:adenosylcobinamide-GDP ribazoletransferase n=1 Tax=Limibacter armeniacum TaxID=466084 RepID=UPI002FE569DD
MKREVHIFFTAIMFYTRLPAPKWIGYHYQEQYLNEATKYFPFIGWVVAGFAAASFWGFQYILPASISLLLSMVISILTTGAFHEDGFADVCDGFGGGWTKEKILTIMKDSRLGTYGSVGLVSILALKFTTLLEISSTAHLNVLVALFTAHAASRFFASIFIYTDRYVRENDDSKAKPIAKKLKVSHLLMGAIFGLSPAIYFFGLYSIAIFGAMLLSWLYLRRYFNKWIGGYTGDCLGAVQQVTEIMAYLAILVIYQL